jgi:hypothetical protein
MGKYDMYRSGNYIPGRIFRVLRTIFLTTCAAAYCAVECREMMARSSWKPLPVKEYHTGDVLLVSQRWYTLPSWGSIWQSFFYKLVMKAVFDQVGIVVVKQGVPHIMCVEYDDVTFMPLQEYLDSRRPRGAAVRHLEWVKKPCEPTAEVAEVFLTEVKKMTPEPWYGITAARKNVREMRHYTLSMEKARALTRTEKKIREHDISPAGLQKQRERDRNIGIILKGYTEEADFPHFSEFKLFNGSLAASFLATFDILDREFPAPTRYTVADFADHLPVKHGTLYADPYIIYKT